MHGNGYLEASGQNMTLPFALATSISYSRGIALLSVYIFHVDIELHCRKVAAASEEDKVPNND